MKIARYPWKPALALWAAGTLASPLLLPYAQALYAVAPQPKPLPAEGLVLVLLVMLRSAVMLAVAVGLGLPAARAVGLGAPFVEAWTERRKPPAPFGSIVKPALLWAALTAFAALAVDAFFFYVLDVTAPAPEIHARLAGVAPWRGFVGALGGGLAEELLYRLFLLSAVAWILVKLFHVTSEERRSVAIWVANFLVAIYFGVEHFGNQALWAPLTPLVALRTVLIILPPGLAFGYLYKKHGFEAAALSHTAIIALVHGVRPWIERGWAG